jgi:hypothetical protein
LIYDLVTKLHLLYHLKSDICHIFFIKTLDGLGYIPISPAHPQKENRLILKGWGVDLRVLGFNPQIKVGN